MGQENIETILFDDPNYHHTFHAIKPRPRVLYALGDLTLLDRKILGVVWPRQASVYAEQVMHDFFICAAQYDLVTISGGAQGIDTLCHELSLQHLLPTIVVLGAWFSHYLEHPRTKGLLARIVKAWGLLLSQFPYEQEGAARTYPARNKIIAWLSRVLFVPAAGKKSGSLLTVNDTLGLQKSVYSVPNSIYDATSEGTNSYIEQRKIYPLVGFEKMLQTYFEKRGSGGRSEDSTESGSEKSVPLSLEEQQLLEILTQGPMKSTLLGEQLGRPIGKVLSTITWLELWWMIVESELGIYKIK